MKRAVAALALVIATATPALAHTESDGYLELVADGATVTGRVDLGARDLDDALDLDDGDGQLRWDEITAATPRLHAYLTERIHLRARSGDCRLDFDRLGVVERADGAHVAVTLRAVCPGPADPLTVDYRALFDVDAQHRGLIRFTAAAGTTVAITAGTPVTLVGGARPSIRSFLTTGVWHIWHGIDHVCFLLALLLPAVLSRRGGRYAPAPALGPVVRDVLAVVTAFTLAHSITLAIATMGWFTLAPRIAEPAIALSVAAAAANNVWPVIDGRWAVAFALGLLHGFGFSSVLVDLGLPGRALGPALFGFNLGVELGQLAIVVGFLPIAFAVRRTRGYRWFVIVGSAAMILVAMHWAIARATA